MKILWIVNTIFPEVAKELGLQLPVVGGWMYSLAEYIKGSCEIDLAVATVYSGKTLKKLEINGIKYYLLPVKKRVGYQNDLEPIWQKVNCDFLPDIIHIHGTEYQHGLACMRIYKCCQYVVSVQGLVGIIERYYYAGITRIDYVKNISLRDILRIDTVFNRKKKFLLRGYYEREYIKRVKNIIGRTGWDYAHTKAINPIIKYYHCDEILRGCFYKSRKWSLKSSVKYSIFLSQATYPVKGLHQVIRAISLLVDDYPGIKVRVAGNSIFRKDGSCSLIKIDGYSLYIKRLIDFFGFNNKIEFVGVLSEENMINEYLDAHVFVCPSSIENSSNSVGESQILGVPTIATYVGGMQDMIKPEENGMLYRFEEVEMLAMCIRKIFDNDDLAEKISLGGIKVAEKRHNRMENSMQTISIYKSILS